jgi:hypothetical protein
MTSFQGMTQCDSTATLADSFMSDNFIPDGQSYRALLFGDQVAEFETTLFGNSKYRIAAYAGMEKEQLVLTMYDEENNILFSNEDFENSPYWDFEVESSLKVRLEAKLDKTKQTSGCAVLLIGFER